MNLKNGRTGKMVWVIVLGIAIGLAAWLLPTTAHADRVDRLINQLESDGDYKVRLAAALKLGKLGDPRAVENLVRALRDKDKTVRGVVAAAVAKLIDGRVAVATRKAAQKELARMAKKDRDSFVRSQAKKALAKIRLVDAGGTARIYVDIGAMSDNGNGNALRPLMRKTVTKTFARKAPDMLTKWQDKKSPTKRELRKAGTIGAFYLDGTLTKLNVRRSGGGVEVRCNLSLVLASYPEKSMFGFIEGTAAVPTGSSRKMIASAKRDCIEAVLENLVEKKVVPTIRQRVP